MRTRDHMARDGRRLIPILEMELVMTEHFPPLRISDVPSRSVPEQGPSLIAVKGRIMICQTNVEVVDAFSAPDFYMHTGIHP